MSHGPEVVGLDLGTVYQQALLCCGCWDGFYFGRTFGWLSGRKRCHICSSFSLLVQQVLGKLIPALSPL